MLVLSRKLDESIWIDGRIEVVVTSIHGNRVTLGISAPKDVPIHRAELTERSQGGNASEANTRKAIAQSVAAALTADNTSDWIGCQQAAGR